MQAGEEENKLDVIIKGGNKHRLRLEMPSYIIQFQYLNQLMSIKKFLLCY